MGLMTTQQIQDTLARYNASGEADPEEFAARMHEARTHIETARTLLWTVRQEIHDLPAYVIDADALTLADAHLAHALTAWDE